MKSIVKTQEKNKYVEARGGRKTAVARVRLVDNASGIAVNGKKYDEYFTLLRHQKAIESPLAAIGGFAALPNKGVSAQVAGGGITGQAEAIRHGLASALIKIDAAWRVPLKRLGFLMRDSRAVERKKYGLKKARRAPQWSKR